MHENSAFMSFSVRHPYYLDLLMTRAKNPSLSECGRIVELHKKGLVQHPIAAEVGVGQPF